MDINNKQNTKALIIAYFFPPYGSIGSSIRMVKFSKYLSDYGWDPVILTIEDPSGMLPQEAHLSVSDISPSLKIYRVPTREHSVAVPQKLATNSSFSNILKPDHSFRKLLRYLRSLVLIPDNQILWSSAALRKGLEVIERENIKIILATCPPFSVAMIGAKLRRHSGIPLIVDVRDDWISTQVIGHKPKWVQRIEKLYEAKVIKAASRVTVVTPMSLETYRLRYPSQANKFVYIPNGVDLNEYLPDNQKKTVCGTKNQRFTVVHSGSLNGNRNPKPICDAIKLLLSERPDIARKLKFIFRGDMEMKYRQMLADQSLGDNIEVAPFLPRGKYLTESQAADALLVISYDMAPTLIPAKVYEYWAMGKPILLLADEGAAKHIVETNKLGWVEPLHEIRQIADRLTRMVGLWEEGKLPAISCRGLEKYDRRYLTSELANVLNAIKPITTVKG